MSNSYGPPQPGQPGITQNANGEIEIDCSLCHLLEPVQPQQTMSNSYGPQPGQPGRPGEEPCQPGQPGEPPPLFEEPWQSEFVQTIMPAPHLTYLEFIDNEPSYDVLPDGEEEQMVVPAPYDPRVGDYQDLITRCTVDLDGQEVRSRTPIDGFWIAEAGYGQGAILEKDGCLSVVLGKYPPPHAKEYPGLSRFKIMRARVWHTELLGFACAAVLEAMSLQSSAILAVSLFSGGQYSSVPFGFRIAYVSSLVLSVVVGLAVSVRTAREHDLDKHLGRLPHCKAIAQRALLEWLSTPPNVMHAPSRFVRQGGVQQTAKNYANCDIFPWPIIGEGFGATIEYQNHQTFLSKLPKNFFNDVVCFCLMIVMKAIYMDGFTTVMLFSAAMTSVMICKKLVGVYNFFSAVRSCRGYLLKKLKDQDLEPLEREHTQHSLKMLEDKLCCVV